MKRLDALDKIRQFSSFSRERCRHLDRYEVFITSLGIPDFQLYVGQTSKQLKCRSLTGPEKLKLCKHISVVELLPEIPQSKCLQIQQLWINLLELNNLFSKKAADLTTLEKDAFESKARDWGRLFIDVYQASNVTPYIMHL